MCIRDRSYASGFLRPFDPLNRAFGYALGPDAELMDNRRSSILFDGDTQNPLKSMANRVAFDSTRYLNNIFEVLSLGTMQTAPSKRLSSKEGDIVPQNIASDIASFRTETPRTSAELLFSKIGSATWKIDSLMKTRFPKGDAMYSELVQPELEHMANYILKTKKFKNGSMKEKREMVKNHLSMLQRGLKKRMNAAAVEGAGMSQLEVSTSQNIRTIYSYNPDKRKTAIKSITGEEDLSIQDLQNLSETSTGRTIVSLIAKEVQKSEPRKFAF